MPMIHLAGALQDLSISITCACTKDFETLIRENGFEFAEIRINLNANSGSAADINQADEEAWRLQEFFDSTRKGAVQTLITQIRHRASDMFANPDEVLDTISRLSQRINPDIWISDQLSYSVTIALKVLELPFISFCPPHPATIPAPGALYGVPRCWPKALQPSREDLCSLEKEALRAEETFDAFPDTLLLVAAGAGADKLRDLQGDGVRIEAFVPQKELLPHVDAVIHHGGVGTFTESLYFGKPSLVMPFSSDQFNVACDVERMKLGIVLDPNRFGERELIHGIGAILEGVYDPQLEYWHAELKRMGPRRVARQVLRHVTMSNIL